MVTKWSKPVLGKMPSKDGRLRRRGSVVSTETSAARQPSIVTMRLAAGEVFE
jgi:hypothetical protein